MRDKHTRRRHLDSLKKEAKRWLDELRSGSAGARTRLDRAVANAPAAPTLRDVQHALALEHGFSGWAALKQAIEQALAADREAGRRAMAQYQAMAEAFNSYTTVTDRTPAVLSEMDSLESITFDTCHELTNAGIARLARLPGLRELRVSGQGVTPDVVGAFSSRVRVSYGQ